MFADTRFRLGRPLGDYFKVQKAVSALIRSRRRFAKPLQDKTYVDIGPGPNLRAGWYNIDWLWRPGMDACWDITRGLPLEAECAQGVYSEHCIEHIPFGAFQQVAREIHRVLKPGGRVRIIVPNAEIYVRRYHAHLEGQPAEPMPFEDGDTGRAGGDYTPVFSLNRIMRDHGHLFIYDAESMIKVLRSAGFSEVKEMAFGVSDDPMLVQDMQARAHESLYVEALK